MPQKLAETEFVYKREKGEGRDKLINTYKIRHQPRNVTRIRDANYIDTVTSQG